MRQFIYDTILAAIFVFALLIVGGEFQDREAKFEEMRQQELVTQVEKAVARISDGK